MKQSTKQTIKFLVGACIAGAGIGLITDAEKEDNKRESYIGYGLLFIGLYQSYSKAMNIGVADALETLNEQGAITNLRFASKNVALYDYLNLSKILK